MNTGPKGWVGMSTPVIQGDSWPSLGQAFAFASPDGFLVAWVMATMCMVTALEQAVLRGGRAEVSGHLWKHTQSPRATLVSLGAIFFSYGALGLFRNGPIS